MLISNQIRNTVLIKPLFYSLLFSLLALQLAAQNSRGIASYYADKFHGRPTSIGEKYDKNAFTCASRDYPVNSILRVSRPDNGKSVEVRVNDCGPHHESRIIDVSGAAAKKLGLVRDGTAMVNIEVVSLGNDGPTCYRSGRATPAPATVQPRNDSPTVIESAPIVVPSPATAERPQAVQPIAAPNRASEVQPTQPVQEFAIISTNYCVQAGCFRDRANALKLLQHLEAKGVSHLFVLERDGLTRVLVGPFDNRAKAEKQKQTMKSRHKVDGWVMQL